MAHRGGRLMLVIGKAVGESSLYTFVHARENVRGVVHVGANVGQEVRWYLSHKCLPLLCFEPHPAAYAELVTAWQPYADDIEFVNCALGNMDGTLALKVPADGDTQRCSRFDPVHLDGHEWTDVPMAETIEVPLRRFDRWATENRLYMPAYNALCIDVQGMEMEVLEGFGGLLDGFEYLCVEMSARPVYDGEVPAGQVIGWLAARGFRQESPTEDHDDVLFRRA